jgi:hypothetical protein
MKVEACRFPKIYVLFKVFSYLGSNGALKMGNLTLIPMGMENCGVLPQRDIIKNKPDRLLMRIIFHKTIAAQSPCWKNAHGRTTGEIDGLFLIMWRCHNVLNIYVEENILRHKRGRTTGEIDGPFAIMSRCHNVLNIYVSNTWTVSSASRQDQESTVNFNKIIIN